MEEPDPGAIYQTAVGFMAAKHMFAANELGLFEAVADGSLSLEDLASSLGIPRRTARISADAMVALGFLEKSDGTYRNTPVATAFQALADPMTCAHSSTSGTGLATRPGPVSRTPSGADRRR